jgi:serine phosphatase RsbU (regulator of sigma subunit)
MLPLMAAFESFWQSYSTTHVVSQLMKTSEAVGVRGTAIYCIFSLIDNKKWLSVTSAGHESLIIFRREPNGLFGNESFPRPGAPTGPMLGGLRKEPLLAHRLELQAGDIVVGYTDGVAEQHEEHEGFDPNRFDADSIVDVVRAFRRDDPVAIAKAIMQKSREHYTEGFRDDATVFVVRVK